METTLMIQIIVASLFAMFMGTLNSLLSYFLDFCFWEGSIFSGYLPWLAKTNLKIFRPQMYHSFDSAKDNPKYDEYMIESAQNMFFFKILGGCAVCSNIWLGFATFTLINLKTDLSWWLLFPYLLFSSFVLRRILK